MGVLGILMLEGKMADVPGCMASAETFGYPVIRHVVRGSRTPRSQEEAEAMLPLYVEAARELEAKGATVITANCGLIALLQDELSAAVTVPVVTSSLALVPAVSKLVGGRPIGVLTFFTEAVGERNFRASGWSSADIPVVLGGVGKHPSWLEFLETKEVTPALREQMRRDLLSVVEDMLAREPSLGAIVCECTMLPAVLETCGRTRPCRSSTS
ncbi:aspartate/glutamate racemase family protein [Lentzea sp. PSKA42]|uniref:Aspartate/glutamate racemase family protein n=1 Tax=Lentzea indica TaxID=2604800 RepID=A0ABX1FF91_9PSEU|nr:aspartate/glutamate racemase family protein [Lentzea indica]NKE57585.1 aspartate/glutamate racemase family protein [Lentzea indica]